MNDYILNKLKPITEEEKCFLNGTREIDRDLYMEKEASIINSKKLLREGKLLAIRTHTRFVHFPEHSHDYVEVVYMCSGQTIHIINGEKITLEEGNLLFLARNTKQEILPAGKDDIAINFIILPEFFDKAITMIAGETMPVKQFMIDCLKNERSETAYLHFKVSDILPIQNLVENLVWTILNDTPDTWRMNQVTMGLLFLELLNYTDRLMYNNKQEELILQTLKYIEDRYVDGSLTDLSVQLHYDAAWLSREIKKRTGKTYTDLVQEKRLSQAGVLLKNTALTVDEIAKQVGYDNISYFHRIFRQFYSSSPKKYRIEK